MDTYLASGVPVPAETIRRHDLLVSKFGLPFCLRNGQDVSVQWQRGPQFNRADALLILDEPTGYGTTNYVELDTGTESVRSQFVERLAGYQTLPSGEAFVLVCTSGERRLRTIAREVRGLGHCLLLKTIAESAADPFGPWRSQAGRYTDLF